MGNKSQIGGVLSIVAGALGVIGGLFMFLFVPIINIAIQTDPTASSFTLDELSVLNAIFIVSGVVAIILSALAITGGVFSIKKKSFGMALTGAIVSIFTVFPLGIAAVILISMGRNEFTKPEAPIAPFQQPPTPPIMYVQPPPQQPPTTT